MSLTPNGARVVMKQLQEIQSSPISGVVLRETEELSEIEADINGPEDTPFFGGVFHVLLVLGEHYPEVPPKGYFKTKIFHPNVSDKGEICVNALKRDWDASLGLRHVLSVIRCLLIEPNPESALNEDAGKLLLEEYDEYRKRACMFTKVHAMPATTTSTTTSANTATTTSVTTTTANNTVVVKPMNVLADTNMNTPSISSVEEAKKHMVKKKNLRRL